MVMKDKKDPKDDRGIAFGTSVGYDDAYEADPGDEYVSELPTAEEEYRIAKETEELNDEGRVANHPSTMARQNDSQKADNHDPFANAESGTGLVNTRIADRESDYQKHRHNQALQEDGMSYKDVMLHADLDRESMS